MSPQIHKSVTSSSAPARVLPYVIDSGAQVVSFSWRSLTGVDQIVCPASFFAGWALLYGWWTQGVLRLPPAALCLFVLATISLLNTRSAVRIDGEGLHLQRGWIPNAWGYQRVTIRLDDIIQVVAGPHCLVGSSEDAWDDGPGFDEQLCRLLIQDRPDHYARTSATLERWAWAPVAAALRHAMREPATSGMFSTFPLLEGDGTDGRTPMTGFKMSPNGFLVNLHEQEEANMTSTRVVIGTCAVAAIMWLVLAGPTA